MKKNVFTALVITFALIFSTGVNAGSLSVADFYLLDSKALPVTGFEVTSGILTDEDVTVEKTFDKTRTFSGKSPKDSVIEITVYAIAAAEEILPDLEEEPQPMLEALETYTLTVGPSGMFAQTVDLRIGVNYVLFKVVSGECESFKSTIIKRKDLDIMLEKGIVLPGLMSKAQVE